jgi:hypothetical protein
MIGSGLLDKVKEQAQTLQQTASDVAQRGQGKLDELQTKRQIDSLARELGMVVYRAKTGQVTDEVLAAETERLTAAIKAQEDKLSSQGQES